MKLSWKKICAVALSGVMCAGVLYQPAAKITVKAAESTPAITEIPGTTKTEKPIDGSFLSVTGFAKGYVNDRSQYKEGDEEYAVVTNEMEFFDAIEAARSDEVEVIEIRSDLYFGWNELSDDVMDMYGNDTIIPYKNSLLLSAAPISNPSMIESGVSTIELNGIDGLTIFSTTGNKLKHAEFKLGSSINDLVIRNLEFTDVWDWDDRRSSGYGSTGALGSTKRTGWSYIKINGAKNVWIDHCNFGVSYDGNVDIENGSSGISITWCNVGDTNYSVGSMLHKTATYLEELYQQNKEDENVGTFLMYSIMRDNGMEVEDIMKYMGHHKKCHLGGGGDSDSWWFAEIGEGLLAEPDPSRSNANEHMRMTFAYNNWTNIGSRVPLIRGGVGHLFNCYMDNTELKDAREQMYNLKNDEGLSIREQIANIGGATHFLFRGMNARNGASIAADTNVYYNVDEPMIGAEHDAEEYLKSEDSKAYAYCFGYNYSLIVNSKVTNTRGQVQIGSSWDNNGDNILANGYGWTDKSTINNWSWGQEGEELSYEYQTFPLEDVETNVKTYGGAYTMDLTAEEWLKVEYPAEQELRVVDKTVEVPITSIELSKAEADLFIEEEFLQLDAKIAPSNTTESMADFTWTSSNPEVATVKNTGLVIPKTPGETIITVTTAKGLKAECKVTVGHLPNKITVTDIPEKIYVGDLIDLSATLEPTEILDDELQWQSAGIRATVLDEAKGIYRADKAGTNQIIVTTIEQGNRIKNKYVEGKSSLKILATDVFVTGVAVNSEIKVNVGSTKALNASVLPANATSTRLLYEVSDSAIATVDENGNVVGVATGETVVTVTSVNGGYSKTCVVKVGTFEEVPGPSTSPEPIVPTEPAVELMLGDANSDGKIELADAQITLKVALKIIWEPTQGVEYNFENMDVNEDGVIGLIDAQSILKYALKIIDNFDDVPKDSRVS